MDHLDKLHELSLRRAEKKDISTMGELIKLEEKSIRTPTVKEISRDKPLNTFADARKALPFAESDEETAEGDAPEVEGEEEEEQAPAAAAELGEVEEGEETETS